MATVDSKQFYTVDQFLHDMQVLPALSASLLRDANDGELYEVLVRRLQDLHLNISEFAQSAKLLHPEITTVRALCQYKNRSERS